MKKKTNYKYKKKICISGGIYKGRFLNSTKNIKIRPTNARVKKTLFNWLQKDIHNATCLDCFSGSGILGIESISRLASAVTALEIQKKLVQNLQKNIKKLSINTLSVFQTNTIIWLKKKSIKKYDIVFLDPPFDNTTLLQKTINLINKNHWIKKNSIIYIEKNKKENNIFFPKEWKIFKKKIIGNVLFMLFYI